VYSLKEFSQLRNLPVPEGEWDGNVICMETNVEWTFGTNETHGFPKRVEEIFLGFLGLLPQHFAEHHDIGFYADRLCITTTYLSRVVRQVSGGRTVVDYINQLLLMEATFLLRQTSLSITQISDQLHFAEVTTFARFYKRMKGMNPREFRKGK
jgi:AraC-like DNA-binding protein